LLNNLRPFSFFSVNRAVTNDRRKQMNSYRNKEKSESNNPLSLVVVDLLYLDLSVCTRCKGTESSLEDSLNEVLELLKNIGKEVQLNKIHIESEEDAIEHHFISSPTIRVNGKDIQMKVKESHCSTCSSLTSGASVDCRIWLYKGKEYTVSPKEMIINAILKEIYNPQEVIEQGNYRIPDNLIEYFDKKDKLCANVSKNNNSCCESNCCSS
jgi:glutaredoxin